jgi:hypothetical protein
VDDRWQAVGVCPSAAPDGHRDDGRNGNWDSGEFTPGDQLHSGVLSQLREQHSCHFDSDSRSRLGLCRLERSVLGTRALHGHRTGEPPGGCHRHVQQTVKRSCACGH